MAGTDPLTRPIGWWLKEADARIDAAFDVALAGTGLDRRRWQILTWLSRAPSSVEEVVSQLGIFDEAAAVTAVVDGFVERGLVERVQEQLRLTPAGIEEQAAASRQVAGVRARVVQAVGQDGYETLVNLLAQLVEGLDPPP